MHYWPRASAPTPTLTVGVRMPPLVVRRRTITLSEQWAAQPVRARRARAPSIHVVPCVPSLCGARAKHQDAQRAELVAVLPPRHHHAWGPPIT